MTHLVDMLAAGNGLAAYAVASTFVNVTLGAVVARLYRDVRYEREARLEQLTTAFERTSDALDRMQRRGRR